MPARLALHPWSPVILWPMALTMEMIQKSGDDLRAVVCTDLTISTRSVVHKTHGLCMQWARSMGVAMMANKKLLLMGCAE